MVTLVVAGVLCVTASTAAAYSALLGGIAYGCPNAIFIRYALRRTERYAPRAVLYGFVLGEAGKLLATAAIFAAAFLWVPDLNIAALFGTFLAMIVINTIGIARMGS